MGGEIDGAEMERKEKKKHSGGEEFVFFVEPAPKAISRPGSRLCKQKPHAEREHLASFEM